MAKKKGCTYMGQTYSEGQEVCEPEKARCLICGKDGQWLVDSIA